MTSLAARLIQPLIRLRMKRRPDDEASMRAQLAQERRLPVSQPRGRAFKGLEVRRDTRCGLSVLTITPPRNNGAPVIYIHGGAYVSAIQSLHWSFIAQLARATGQRFIVPLYPLAPEATYVAAHDELLALYGEVAGDAPPILMGDSAGAGLALAVTQRADAAGLPAPAGLVLISPWLDVRCGHADQPAIEPHDVMLSLDRLRVCGEWWADDAGTDHPAVSPLLGPLANLPPTLLIAGSNDVLVTDARALKAAAPTVTYIEEAGLCHDFPLLPFPEGKAARQQIAAFIATLS